MSRCLVVALLTFAGAFCGCSSMPADHRPAPNDYGAHFAGVQSRQLGNAANTLQYMLFSVNSDYPPYDTWGDQLGRNWSTSLKTFDRTIMNTDWDDPYID